MLKFICHLKGKVISSLDICGFYKRKCEFIIRGLFNNIISKKSLIDDTSSDGLNIPLEIINLIDSLPHKIISKLRIHGCDFVAVNGILVDYELIVHYPFSITDLFYFIPA